MLLDIRHQRKRKLASLPQFSHPIELFIQGHFSELATFRFRGFIHAMTFQEVAAVCFECPFAQSNWSRPIY